MSTITYIFPNRGKFIIDLEKIYNKGEEVIMNLEGGVMSLQKQIELDMREAMKVKAKETNILKYFVAEFSRRPNLNIDLTDAEVISLIKKYIKSIEETIKLTNKTTEEQLFEIKVLSRYLPKQASEEEIKEWISSNIELPENPNARMKYMKDIMKHFGSSVDGNVVKNILMSM